MEEVVQLWLESSAVHQVYIETALLQGNLAWAKIVEGLSGRLSKTFEDLPDSIGGKVFVSKGPCNSFQSKTSQGGIFTLVFSDVKSLNIVLETIFSLLILDDYPFNYAVQSGDRTLLAKRDATNVWFDFSAESFLHRKMEKIIHPVVALNFNSRGVC